MASQGTAQSRAAGLTYLWREERTQVEPRGVLHEGRDLVALVRRAGEAFHLDRQDARQPLDREALLRVRVASTALTGVGVRPVQVLDAAEVFDALQQRLGRLDGHLEAGHRLRPRRRLFALVAVDRAAERPVEQLRDRVMALVIRLCFCVGLPLVALREAQDHRVEELVHVLLAPDGQRLQRVQRQAANQPLQI